MKNPKRILILKRMTIKTCQRCKKSYESFDYLKYNYFCKECQIEMERENKRNEIKKVSAKFIILLFLGIILLPNIISAEQIFQQNQKADIKIQCMFNGSFCPSTSYCNLTVNYPNGNLFVNNNQMTNQFSFYNYTLANSSILGIYSCSALCCYGSFCNSNECDFQITPTGQKNMLGFFIMISIVIMGITILGISIRNIPVTMIGSLGCMAWGLYTAIYGFDIFKNTGSEILSIMIIGFGMFWATKAGIESFQV